MKENSKLFELALLFKPYSILYAVGGYVRDNILNINSDDIDVCSSLGSDKVKEILKDSPFVVQNRNLRMGTLIITYDDFSVEYTTFRTESYSKLSGNHTPNDVVFTNDILLDAKRRDFKCNAVYYDIVNDKIVDVVGGVKDIENKIISTADDPHIVFEADGLRLLRLVRFAVELGFDIDKDTFNVAKENAWRIKDIAKERIRDELDKIFTAELKHKDLKLDKPHLRGIRLLDELGLLEILLPEVTSLKGLAQPVKYHIYNAYEHTIKAFEVSRVDIRWEALLHDIGKRKCVEENGNMHGHEFISADMARDIANRYKFSNERKYTLVNLVKYHMIDINGNMGENKLRKFVCENYPIIDKLIELKRADGFATKEEDIHVRLEDIVKGLKEDNSPLSIKDLKVNGQDLIDLGILESERAKIMKDLWLDTICNPALNTREKALDYLKRRCKK